MLAYLKTCVPSYWRFTSNIGGICGKIVSEVTVDWLRLNSNVTLIGGRKGHWRFFCERDGSLTTDPIVRLCVNMNNVRILLPHCRQDLLVFPNVVETAYIWFAHTGAKHSHRSLQLFVAKNAGLLHTHKIVERISCFPYVIAYVIFRQCTCESRPH